MSDEEFVERCLRLIARLQERGTLSVSEATDLQLDLYRAVAGALG